MVWQSLRRTAKRAGTNDYLHIHIDGEYYILDMKHITTESIGLWFKVFMQSLHMTKIGME